jgi:hypothetical protein
LNETARGKDVSRNDYARGISNRHQLRRFVHTVVITLKLWIAKPRALGTARIRALYPPAHGRPVLLSRVRRARQL